MYLLDTNIVSTLDPRRRVHSTGFVDWLERNGAGLYLSVMSITELDAGALKLKREGKTARAGEIASLVTAILADFSDRVLPVDIETARVLAQLAEQTHRQPVDLPDLIIAATAARHGLVVLTRNLGHFTRLDVAARDPLVDLPPDI